MASEMTEIEKREFEVKYARAKRLAKEYVTDLVMNKKLIIIDEHQTNLRYELDNQPQEAIENITSKLAWNFFDRDTLNDDNEIHIEGNKCFACGKSVYYRLDGNKLIPEKLEGKGNIFQRKWVHDNSPCMKIEPYSIEITIPTGNLIVVSWTENGGEVILPCIDEKEQYLDINSFKGKVDTSKLYAEKLNMAHFFVGNNSPSVFVAKKNNGYIAIGRNGYNEKTDKDIPIAKGLKEVGSICTDLWWSTAFDYSVYEKMCIEHYFRKMKEENNGEELTQDQIINATAWGKDLASKDCKKSVYGVVNIQVKPGKYKCTTYYDCKTDYNDDECYKPELYSKMEWIAE